MNSGKRWRLRVAKRVEKKLRKFPAVDRDRILETLEGMQQNPFAGDMVRLKSQPSTWRRRVGDYRIFFDADPKQGVVEVVDVVRRTSTTY